MAEPLAGARGNVSYADHACDCLLSVHVRNTGKMPAAETVLFRHSIWTSRAVRWTRSLSGFGRVQLKPSEGSSRGGHGHSERAGDLEGRRLAR